MFVKEKPSFTKEYANRVSKADFITHFKDVYTSLSSDELGAEWDALQEKKTDKPDKEVKK